MMRFVLPFIPALIIYGLTACSKNPLPAKRDRTLVVPHSEQELLELLDDTAIMNGQLIGAAEISADGYYLPDPVLDTISPVIRNLYQWQKDVWDPVYMPADWAVPYRRIFYANRVLEGVSDTDSNSPRSKNLEGMAFFHRAYNHFLLAQLFAGSYQKATTDTDLGIPLKRAAHDSIVTRGTIGQTYACITADLRKACRLLPPTQATSNRPCRAAASGLLARVLVQMGAYNEALYCVHTAIMESGELMRFKDQDSVAIHPFGLNNSEILFYDAFSEGPAFDPATSRVDTDLLRSYEPGDLRRAIYFKPVAQGTIFRGSYSGTDAPFCGIALDELYLLRAECNARLGNSATALKDLNTLRRSRWEPEMFEPLQATDPQAVLDLVIAERRKEYYFRGLRWSDLRRLNLEPRYAHTINRATSGKQVTLIPGDLNYILPIPQQEIILSGIQQNTRR
ncbi:MAG TPA: RagB/SusD family nutrient uptake outer membrane protein [Chitinophaga sp.]|uniref:RagB/SusD family nutrient uptake outer membrane protein n=1 Tax=Chitinophaga sp. TaxID=1869181 RepID=UPI002C997F04|nr:RagB/SusD family nutrient uptake outer membrane protein [Chitinophaga sp.]HVI44600.1 RagB/SusD family nutrient uptake outer membrane protein [Chitinophaga sp.]